MSDILNNYVSAVHSSTGQYKTLTNKKIVYKLIFPNNAPAES